MKKTIIMLISFVFILSTYFATISYASPLSVSAGVAQLEQMQSNLLFEEDLSSNR